MRRTVAAVALLVLATTTACGNDVDIQPLDNPVTGPVPSGAPPASLPAPTGTWAGLAAKCPALTSAGAVQLGVSGEGRPTKEYVELGHIVIPDCEWGSTDAQGHSVTARMSIYQAQAAADAQWQALRTGATDKVDGLGREAFASAEPDAMSVRVLSNNVVAVVRVRPPAASASPDRIAQLRDATVAITKDVLDDLR